MHLVHGKFLRKRRDFLELLDDINSFIFHLYIALPKGFKPVMFYTDVICRGNSSMTQIHLPENLDFPSFTGKSLALLALSIPFLGDNSEEMNVIYAPF